MSNEMTTIQRAFFLAQADLLTEMLEALQRDDPGAHKAVASTLEAGGFLQIESAAGNAGLVGVNLFLIAPAGQRALLLSLE